LKTETAHNERSKFNDPYSTITIFLTRLTGKSGFFPSHAPLPDEAAHTESPLAKLSIAIMPKAWQHYSPNDDFITGEAIFPPPLGG
jgi:hypothetical protein